MPARSGGEEKKEKMFSDDVKTSRLSYTPLDTHSEKGGGVKKKKCREGGEKKASDKFNLQGLETVHADRPILVLLIW